MEEDYINKIEGADLGNDNEISEVGDEDEGWGGRRELQLWRARFDRDRMKMRVKVKLRKGRMGRMELLSRFLLRRTGRLGKRRGVGCSLFGRRG